jgi:transposase
VASIISKKVNGQTYYYLREMARVGGKPKMVSERYLGKAADIEAAMDGAEMVPERTRHLAFGDLAAAWSVLERLGVRSVIDEVIGARRGDAAASVGTYIVLATLNRVVAPCSKLAFQQWWGTTAGDRLVKMPAGATDHRKFWDAMDEIPVEKLTAIEDQVTTRAVETFGIATSGLVLDMTNFATYIDSTNPRAPIAQRGHAKQKRNDLRLVGLGLVAARDGGIPLLSHAYAGDRPDVTQFATVVSTLARRFGRFGDLSELTLVYDAGQDSAKNQLVIEGTGMHFVGSLRPSDHPDLLAVSPRRYRVVDDEAFPGLSAFEARADALGSSRRVVVTHSDELHESQSRGFDQTMRKARRRLHELQRVLEGGRGRRSRAGVLAEIAEATKARWVRRCIQTTLVGEEPGELSLEIEEDPAWRRALEAELFGKRVLFTDQEDWSVAEIVAAYRSQWMVEADFRQMKDPSVVSFSPMFHWTEQKIRVHVFYCTLALMVARLMVREAERAGLHMSVRALLASLAGIEETVLLYPSAGGRPRARRLLTEMDETQTKLYELFGLATYAPRS